MSTFALSPTCEHEGLLKAQQVEFNISWRGNDFTQGSNLKTSNTMLNRQSTQKLKLFGYDKFNITSTL